MMKTSAAAMCAHGSKRLESQPSSSKWIVTPR
eukprot:CAMPEP_0180667714 /NCGR_PEP_ID=MMETSP1037_2-20121125/62529_1 /TAXON_ID=632150 /ORGANISM="Azadinium spinosum, Strain 3D9" /LENGTH=31 /DNA_ID= /DNA_START= /DNA_END= /DNA_ORIENTATION=